MFKITHNGHIENMCKSLEDFLIEKKFCDISLQCMDGSLECSRLYLAASSQVLCQIMNSNQEVDIIFLPETNIGILSKLLHIITGPKQVMKDERISNEVIKLALLLKINLPQDMMSKTILKTTDKETKVSEIVVSNQEEFQPFSCEFCYKLLNSECEGREHNEYCATNNVWYTVISKNRFQCKLCRSILKKKLALKNHLAFVHSETLPYSCDECKESFITNGLLKYHKFEHKSTKDINHDYYYHFNINSTHLPKDEKEKVLASYQTQLDEEKVKCVICSKVFLTKNISFHLVNSHLKLTFFECSVCGMKFGDDYQLIVHQHNEHKADKVETIDDGTKYDKHQSQTKEKLTEIEAFNEIEDINDYLYKFENEETYLCSLCIGNKVNSFSSLSSARNHILKQHVENHENSCDMCDRLFPSEADLRLHMCVEEDGEKLIGNYHNIQGTVYIPWSKAKIIVDSYLTKISNGFQCILCAFSAFKIAKMRRHALLHHLKMYVYQCDECFEEFKFKSDFAVHLKSAHGKSIEDYSIISVKSKHELSSKTSASESANGDKPKNREIYNKPEDEELKTPPNDLNHLNFQYHLLENDLYVGAENGKKIVKEYYSKAQGRTYACKLCNFKSASQGVEYHIFAKHLTKLILYSCDICGKQFRYSKKSYLSHILEHTVGKLGCSICIQLGINLDKRLTSDSLQAHQKRFHCSDKEYFCPEPGCQESLETAAHLKKHEIDQHIMSKKTKFMCSICQHFFPTNFQLSSHMESCEAGRSRTLFRKQLAKSLTWLGTGIYKCNHCGEEFRPPRPTASSLPKARNHVVAVHKQTHLRKTKMSWTQGVEGLNIAKKEARKIRLQKE